MSAADLAELRPDDCLAILAKRHGEAQLEAYVSLARSRGVPVPEVLKRAVADDLAAIIGGPEVTT